MMTKTRKMTKTRNGNTRKQLSGLRAVQAFLMLGLLLGMAGGAGAQTIVDDNFNRANTALGTVTGPSGAAGQTYNSPSTGAAYVVSNASWQISGGQLVAVNPAAGSNLQNTVLRPASEAFKQGGIQVTTGAWPASNPYLELRLHEQANGDGLYCAVNTAGGVAIGWHNAGSTSGSYGGGQPGFVAGHKYIFNFASDNSATSALTVTVADAATPGTVMATYGPFANSASASADTNSAGTAGVGTFPSNASVPISRLVTYQGSGPSQANATAYTSSESSTSGGAGVAVTQTYTGNGPTTATVTPAVSGVTGTFSPATIALSGTTPVAVTFTPSSTGMATFSSTNNGGLTDPPALTYTVTAPPITIPVSSAAFRFSPGNWVGDAGRNSGSVYRQTWNPGAYFTATWATTSASPTANILFDETGLNTNAQFSYFLDGSLTDNVARPNATGAGSLAISGLSGAGTHTLTCYVVSSAQVNRWGGSNTNVIRVTGLQVDSSSTAGTAPAMTGWDWIIGDSIWEGVGVPDWLQDQSAALGFGLRQSQGWDFCESNCGGNGWLYTGDNNNDVPAWYSVSGGVYSQANSRWDKVDATHSILDSAGQVSAYGQTGTLPSAIVCELLANESLHGLSTADTAASVTGWLTALHQGTTPAAPGVPVFIAVSPGMYSAAVYGNGAAYIAALKAGVSSYKAAYPADSKVTLIDLGAGVSNALASTVYGAAVHYNSLGHQFVAPLLLAPIQKALAPAATTRTIRRIN